MRINLGASTAPKASAAMQKIAQLGHQPAHVRRGSAGTGGGNAGQDGKQYHRRKIFNQQDADNGLAPAGTQVAPVAQSLQQDGRTADGHGAAEIQSCWRRLFQASNGWR